MYDILNINLKQIFSRIGRLKRCGIHWDNLGNSKGTADVEYEKPDDARKAFDEFDSMNFNYFLEAEIDGMAMKLTFAKGEEQVTRVTLKRSLRFRRFQKNYGSFKNRSNFRRRE
jgi:RNA recognition motif-containing protein